MTTATAPKGAEHPAPTPPVEPTSEQLLRVMEAITFDERVPDLVEMVADVVEVTAAVERIADRCLVADAAFSAALDDLDLDGHLLDGLMDSLMTSLGFSYGHALMLAAANRLHQAVGGVNPAATRKRAEERYRAGADFYGQFVEALRSVA